ncbi:MAG: VOC family protein [Ilumatobacter sp.]|nr:VOC family protein [Ilumatobacter sp.]
MPAIDHLVYVVPDVDAGVEQIEAATGVRAAAGGAHEGRGTHNALLAFDDTTYLEIIGPDPGQPEPAGPRPFGVTADSVPHLATFAVHPVGDESLADVVGQLGPTGVPFGEPEPMSRARPDGTLLSWQLALPTAGGGVVPFAIDWGDTPNPAGSLPVLGRLHTLLVTHPDEAVRAAIGGIDDRIRVTEGRASLMAVINTLEGQLTLR